MGQELTIFLLALLCLGHVYTQPFDLTIPTTNSPSKVQYCGSQLSKAISTFCKGNYNTIASVMQASRNADNHDLKFPYKRRAEATSTFRHQRKKRTGGLSDECCKKPCSYEELKTFCALM